MNEETEFEFSISAHLDEDDEWVFYFDVPFFEDKESIDELELGFEELLTYVMRYVRQGQYKKSADNCGLLIPVEAI